MVRYDKFFGGIAQDDRMQSIGQYTYGQNIDIRKGKWIELARKPEDVGQPIAAPNYITAAYVEGPGVYWLGTDNGKIYYTNDGGPSSYELFDTGSTSDIIDIQIMGTSLFFFSGDYVYTRTTYTDGNPWVLGGNVTRSSNVVSNYRQSITVGDDAIFFINGKYIGKIFSSTPTSIVQYGSAFTKPFQTQAQIVGLTLHGNSLWCYDESGKMYALDNQSEEVIGFKDFKEKIIAVKNMGGYDAVLTTAADSQYTRSWIMNTGVSPESSKLMKKTRFSETVKKGTGGVYGKRFVFNRNNDNTDLCFSDVDQLIFWSGDDQGEPVIYSYGKNDNTLPDSFSIISNSDAYGVTWNSIKAMWIDNGYLFVQTASATSHLFKIKIIEGDGEKLCPNEGYIITKVDDFGQYEVPKIIKQVMVGADIPAGTSIKLEYSVNEGDFVEYRTITNTDAIGTNGKKFEFSEPIDMFNEISWKITLITTDETLTPKLYSFSHMIESELYEQSK